MFAARKHMIKFNMLSFLIWGWYSVLFSHQIWRPVTRLRINPFFLKWKTCVLSLFRLQHLADLPTAKRQSCLRPPVANRVAKDTRGGDAALPDRHAWPVLWTVPFGLGRQHLGSEANLTTPAHDSRLYVFQGIPCIGRQSGHCLHVFEWIFKCILFLNY